MQQYKVKKVINLIYKCKKIKKNGRNIKMELINQKSKIIRNLKILKVVLAIKIDLMIIISNNKDIRLIIDQK